MFQIRAATVTEWSKQKTCHCLRFCQDGGVFEKNPYRSWSGVSFSVQVGVLGYFSFDFSGVE
ncbi:MAG: hypothetical protein FWH27_17200, partial [Planctomycetaceae bacterium]|nr:hypothetical protein [Planctomycetaceae bacterium]